MKKFSTPFATFTVRMNESLLDFNIIDVTESFNQLSKNGENITRGVVILPMFPEVLPKVISI